SGCRLVVVGDPAGSVGRVDGSRQCIEQLAEPTFALAQRCLRAQSIEGYDIGAVAGRTESQCGNRPIKFAFQKSCCLIHFPVPLNANWATIASFLEQSDNPQRQRGFRQKVARSAANFRRLYGLALTIGGRRDWL